MPRIVHRLVAAALPGLFAAAAIAGGNGLPSPLMPYEAEYQLTDGSSRVGSAVMGLEPAGGGWRYYSRVKPEGLFALFVGKVSDSTLLEVYRGGLRPLRYRHDGGDKEKQIEVEFHWGAGEARVSGPQGNATLPLEPGSHDQFSAMLAVILAFSGDKERLELPSIDDEGEAEPLVFELAGRESIEVPLGTWDTIHVRRIRENSKRETESWLAPELDWVPVRIDQRRKGELVARLELVGLNGETADLSEAPPR